jgi:CBS-domain-containing membrane protein
MFSVFLRESLGVATVDKSLMKKALALFALPHSSDYQGQAICAGNKVRALVSRMVTWLLADVAEVGLLTHTTLAVASGNWDLSWKKPLR